MPVQTRRAAAGKKAGTARRAALLSVKKLPAAGKRSVKPASKRGAAPRGTAKPNAAAARTTILKTLLARARAQKSVPVRGKTTRPARPVGKRPRWHAVKSETPRIPSAVPTAPARSKGAAPAFVSLPGREAAMGPKYFFSTEIPDNYNETYMRAIPRDAQWLFAYWELSGETVELMRRHVGADVFNSSKWVLRVLDVTDVVYNGANAWRHMDLELSPYATTWYVKVWEPGRTYMLQCGILTPDLRFFSAVNSNAAQMPRNSLSAVLDQEWTTASTDELIRLSGYGAGRGPGASENSPEFSVAVLNAGSGSGSGSLR